MSPTMLCAIADDDRLHDVVDTGRIMAATGRLRPVFVHVGRCSAIVPAPVGFGVGAGAAAAALHAYESPAEQAREVGAALVEAADLWDDPAILVTGDPVAELERIGSERDAALVVAGTHGRGLLSGALHGSVSRGLARTGSRPVLLVRRGAVPALGGPVVCAVDLATRHHVATATHAARLAEWTGRRLVLVHVLRLDLAPIVGGPVLAPVPLEPSDHEREAAREALEGLAAGLPVEDVECAVLDPAPVAPRLDELARNRGADLLVVGSRGSGALRTAVEGSVSQELLRTATCPLVVVPPAAGHDKRPAS